VRCFAGNNPDVSGRLSLGQEASLSRWADIYIAERACFILDFSGDVPPIVMTIVRRGSHDLQLVHFPSVPADEILATLQLIRALQDAGFSHLSISSDMITTDMVITGMIITGMIITDMNYKAVELSSSSGIAPSAS
jgi:hypothetical protein